MNRRFLTIALLAAAALPAGPVQVTVNCGKVVNVMRGGLGASWHAIEAVIPYGVKHPVLGIKRQCLS